MNISEAYKLLDLKPGATEEEANKQFRKLAAKYHPDQNKDPGAAETYKKYSEALSTIKAGPSAGGYQDHGGIHVRTWSTTGNSSNVNMNDIKDIFETIMSGGGPVNFGGGFRRSAQRPFKRQEPVETSLHLTFAEAVLGCKKQVILDKYVKCGTCYGKGFNLSDDCKNCQGKGHYVTEEKIEGKDLKVRTTCQTCEGLGKSKTDCEKCNKNGSLKIKTTIDVNLPGGIVSGSRLKLSGQGNYNRFSGNDYYEDAHIMVTVDPEPSMSIAGLDVISSIEVSLLDALKGGSQMVKTVKGPISVQIPQLAKNKDRVFIPGAGVGGKGNHVVVLDIKYPDDTQGLIDFLSEKE